jgi:hypothetical protein
VLALRAEEAPATALTVDAPIDFSSASRTCASPIHLEILPQRENLPQFEKAKRERASISDDAPKFPGGYVLHLDKGTRAGAEQYLVLDDVADAGKNRLVQKNIRNFSARERADLAQRRPRIPLRGHDVRSEIVARPCVTLLDELHGGGPYGDLTVVEGEDQARRARATIVARDRRPVDSRRKCAPQHEMHAQGECVELKDEVFAPREDIVDSLAG